MNEARETLDTAGLVPKKDSLERFVAERFAKGQFERADDSVAPIMVEKLRYNYARVYEQTYADLKAAMGMVCPFDTSPDPAHDTYKYDVIDYAGYADWIGDDGSVMGESSIEMSSHIGFMHELGNKFSFTVFDLERAAMSGGNLLPTKQNAVRRTHEAKHNWTWLFGDGSKELHGLFTHPNIQVALAPMASTAVHSDNRDRLIENKSADEILADVETIVETVPRTTNEKLRVRKVFMPYADVSVLKRRRDGTGADSVTLWQLVQQMFPDVEFDTLPECDASKRSNPKTGVNDSGVSGRCWIAVPDLPADECGFVFPRPFTQRAPQESDLKISTITHSKIGGFKCVQPLGVIRLDFVAVDNATAAP
jgi:hypothetical protein